MTLSRDFKEVIVMSYMPSVTPDYGYGYSSGSAVASIVLTILAILFAIGGAVVLFLFVLPGKNAKSYPASCKWRTICSTSNGCCWR